MSMWPQTSVTTMFITSLIVHPIRIYLTHLSMSLWPIIYNNIWTHGSMTSCIFSNQTCFSTEAGLVAKYVSSPGPCITNVFATRRKNISQWHRSFQRKLRSHWLKFLRHVAITLVIQGPGCPVMEVQLSCYLVLQNQVTRQTHLHDLIPAYATAQHSYRCISIRELSEFIIASLCFNPFVLLTMYRYGILNQYWTQEEPLLSVLYRRIAALDRNNRLTQKCRNHIWYLVNSTWYILVYGNNHFSTKYS